MNFSDALPVALKSAIEARRLTWLVTGVAGFIGSNLLEALLTLGQNVKGIDNFATGKPENLDRVREIVGSRAWAGFEFNQGDIRDDAAVRKLMHGTDIVLHQAALGSVPRSVADPLTSNEVNVSGFLTVLNHARECGVGRFVYAGSSSTYGDHPTLPKVEDNIGKPLSPYAVTKLVNEVYADVFGKVYGYRPIGLRYFNVFGPRQDPNGAYAAVIPRWAAAMVRDEPIHINGDGETSRDFCFVANTVQANLLAGIASADAEGEVFNVAVGGRTSLNQLFQEMRSCMANLGVVYAREPIYGEERQGDVRHSQADISKIKQILGYEPMTTFKVGLRKAMPYYVSLFRRRLD